MSESLIDQLETREDVASAAVQGLIQLSGDAVAAGAHDGTTVTDQTVTYRLERLSGRMLHYCQLAAHPASRQAVVMRCPENNSILLFNKCYGVDVDVPVRPAGQDESVATMHLVSVVRQRPSSPDDLQCRFDAARTVYMPAYGGVFTDPADGKQYMKPCAMDVETRDIMNSTTVGWMSLWYVNSGRGDDPCPTGIVAMEGRVFAMPAGKTVREIAAAPPASYQVTDEAVRDAAFADIERRVKQQLRAARRREAKQAKKAGKK